MIKDKCIQAGRDDLLELKSSKNMSVQQLEECHKSALEYIENWYVKADINKFISQHYNSSASQCYAWILNSIYKGTYRNIGIAIPPKHLLNMWQIQINNLNKIYLRNKSKGKNFTDEGRVKYDLAILVNKYDGYLNWLQKQELLKAEKENNKQENLSEITSAVSKNKKVNNNIEDDIIIDVDEVFGGE